jgi:hypothetical protein
MLSRLVAILAVFFASIAVAQSPTPSTTPTRTRTGTPTVTPTPLDASAQCYVFEPHDDGEDATIFQYALVDDVIQWPPAWASLLWHYSDCAVLKAATFAGKNNVVYSCVMWFRTSEIASQFSVESATLYLYVLDEGAKRLDGDGNPRTDSTGLFRCEWYNGLDRHAPVTITDGTYGEGGDDALTDRDPNLMVWDAENAFELANAPTKIITGRDAALRCTINGTGPPEPGFSAVLFPQNMETNQESQWPRLRVCGHAATPTPTP